MKVLLVSPSYAPIVGGTETLVRRLATELNSSGINTDVLTFNMDRKWKLSFREVTEYGKFKVFKISGIANPLNFLPINPLYLVLRFHAIPKPNFTKLFADYDIIHFCDEEDLSFPIFSFFTQKPKVMQCLTPFSFELIRRNFFHRKTFTKIADMYIPSSLSQVSSLLEMGIAQSKITTIGTVGIDIDTFKPNETLRVGNLLLFVGRLQKLKGVHVLLQALSGLKVPTQIAIVGPFDQSDLNYTNEIKKMVSSINEKGLHKVQLMGPLGEADLVNWYQKSVVLVRPDLNGISGGLTTLEAFACGTPVLGTGNHIVKDGVNGLIVPPNNPEELEKALTKLLEDEELSRRYGLEGRKFVEDNYSWKKIAGELIKMYEAFLRNYYS